MNKNKKIAMAVVATVMAGTMAIPLAACNRDPDKVKVDLSQYAWNVLKENGDIDYEAYKRDSEVTLSIAIGHNSDTTSTAFASGSTYTLVDGTTYQGGDMKPAWKQMGKDLNITWNDVYAGKPTNSNLNDIISGDGKVSYAETDMFTTDLSVAVSKANSGTDILNLADYLDYMPNFKSFLETNPIVYLSLLQDGMSTTDGSGKKLYVAPYFDGNDDIERYCIIRQDWTDLLLGTTAITGGEKFTEKCAATTSVQPYMIGKDYIEVDVTSPTPVDGKYTQVGKVYKNYKNVKAQVTTADTALNTAYLAASNNTAYCGATGNIVELMNAAIAANANVTGSQLVALFRAYIDACYTTTSDGTTSYYTNRADLFNGYDAAWDVDDLVAMLRCVMTNQNTLLSTDDGIANRTQRKIYGIVPRTGENDRTPDMVRLACQLYGVRGGDSRLEHTYIDNAGNLQDARNDKEFYVALDNMNKLKAEGLVADYSGISSFKSATGYIVDKADQTKSSEAFMMYDYCQTQTQNGFYAQQATGTTVPDGYNFAPVLTPVAKWDVDGNGTVSDSEYFRFTESWRSTKTSGLALNGSLAYDKDKLIASLQFVDYLYSDDGQIVSTFGPMATNAEGTGGFWYNTEASQAEKDAGAYFTYKGVKYSGYNYKGKVAPTITDKLYKSFQGASGSPTLPDNVSKAKLSFTNYARFLIGSTLPVGVKSQAFEDQLTSEIGKGGSAKVAAALSNKTASGYTVIRGLTLNVNENDWWYTCVPTSLPTPQSYVSSLTATNMTDLRYLTGEAKKSKDTAFLNIFNSVILQGVKAGSQHKQQDITYDFTTIDDLVTYMSQTKLAQTRENVYNEGWKNAKAYWNYLKPTNNG